MTSRDFTEYSLVYGNRPFEPTLEHFRRRRIGEKLAPEFLQVAPHVLDVGIGREAVSRHLPFPVSSLTLVEPMSWALDRDEEKYGAGDGTEVRFCGVFDDFVKAVAPTTKFDLVIFSGLLHEMTLSESERAISSSADLLSKHGLVVAVVPNRNSLHRVLGVHMGIQESLDTMTEAEVRINQQTGYSVSSLNQSFETRGFRTHFSETFFLKLSSHAQMEKFIASGSLSQQALETLYLLSEVLPEHGAEVLGIYKPISG